MRDNACPYTTFRVRSPDPKSQDMEMSVSADSGGGRSNDSKLMQLQCLLEAERQERAADVQKLRSELDQQQQVLNEFAEQMISLTDAHRENLQKQQGQQAASDHMAALEAAVLAQEKEQATLMDLLDLEREARGAGLGELGAKLSQELMLIVDLAEKQGEKLKLELDVSADCVEKKFARLSKEFSDHNSVIDSRLRDLTSRLECWEMRCTVPLKGAASTAASGCDGDDLSTQDGCDAASLDETTRGSVLSFGSSRRSRSRVSLHGAASTSALAAPGAPRSLADIQGDLRTAYRRLQEQCDAARDAKT